MNLYEILRGFENGKSFSVIAKSDLERKDPDDPIVLNGSRGKLVYLIFRRRTLGKYHKDERVVPPTFDYDAFIEWTPKRITPYSGRDQLKDIEFIEENYPHDPDQLALFSQSNR